MTLKDLKRYPEMAEPQLRPRYSGVATFFRTPLVDDLNNVDIGVIGVPFDGGVPTAPVHDTGPVPCENRQRLCVASIKPRA